MEPEFTQEGREARLKKKEEKERKRSELFELVGLQRGQKRGRELSPATRQVRLRTEPTSGAASSEEASAGEPRECVASGIVELGCEDSVMEAVPWIPLWMCS